MATTYDAIDRDTGETLETSDSRPYLLYKYAGGDVVVRNNTTGVVHTTPLLPENDS